MTDTATRTNLTEREAAAHLRVSPRQLRRWRDAGKITYSRLGDRTVVYVRSDLDEFVAARKVAAVVVPMTR